MKSPPALDAGERVAQQLIPMLHRLEPSDVAERVQFYAGVLTAICGACAAANGHEATRTLLETNVLVVDQLRDSGVIRE